MEEVISMIQTSYKTRFYDISDVLRIFLLRIQIQKRNFSDLTAPFMKIYKHQRNLIKENFENKNRQPFEVNNSYILNLIIAQRF